MKKVKVVNNVTGLQYGGTREDPTDWINEQISLNAWGLPEHWEVAKILELLVGSDGQPVLDENGNKMYSEVVLKEIPEGADTEEVVLPSGNKEIKFKVPCEYTIEIIDLDTDPEYQFQKQLEKADQAIAFGQQVIKYVWVKLNMKALPAEGVYQFNSTFAPITMVLQNGAISAARTAIASIAPDAVVTQADLNEILGLIDNFLATQWN